MNIPERLTVNVCPDHGSFIDTDNLGCPEQIDYDGVTCGKRRGSAEYVHEDVHQKAVDESARLREALVYAHSRLFAAHFHHAASRVATVLRDEA